MGGRRAAAPTLTPLGLEIIENNGALLVGPNFKRIIDGYSEIKHLIPSFSPIFGDGKAGHFICDKIVKELK